MTKLSRIKRSFNPFSLIDRDNFLLAPIENSFNEVLNDLLSDSPFFRGEHKNNVSFGSYPKVNVIDHDDSIEIIAELAGYSKEDVTVELVDNDYICICGKKSTKEPAENTRKYLYRELKRSAFSRTFTLGDQLDKKSISAKFEDGLLSINISKLKDSVHTEVHKIEVK